MIMNRIKIYIFILGATLGWSSCTDSMEGIIGDSSQSEIGLSTYIETLSGRAAAIEGNSDFQVDGSEFGLCVNAYDNGTYNIANTTVTYTNGKWVAGETLYWPTSETAVDFYAWRPKDITMLSNENYSSFNDFLMFDYDTKAATTPSSNNIILYKNEALDEIIHKTAAGEDGLQEDVMFALTLDRKNPTQQSVDGETPNYNVELQFKHTLTRLRFQYNTEVELTTDPITKIEVRIKAMTLHNVYSKGTCYIFGNNNIQWTSWTFADALPNYHSVPMPWSNDNFVSGSTATVISSTNDLMVIPQTLNKWNTSSSYAYSIAANDGYVSGTNAYYQSYLRIYCDLQQVITRNGVDTVIPLWGDYTASSSTDTEITTYASHCVYVPIDDKDADGKSLWQAGNQVTYTLTFGGGYDVYGNLVLNPIEVVPTLTNWVESSNDEDI